MFINCLKVTQPFGAGNMLGLKEYDNIARKLIASHTSQGVRAEMLRSDDVIADLINELAYADSTFDGRGTKEGYRAFRFYCYVRKYLKKKKRQTSCIVQNFTIDANLIDDSINYEKRSDNKDHVEYLLSNLPPFYARVLKAKYIERKTLREIGTEENLTHARIGQILEKAEELCKSMLG